jgi:hypothetical protein
MGTGEFRNRPGFSAAGPHHGASEKPNFKEFEQVRTGWRSNPGVNADDGVTYAANLVDVAAGGPALTGRFHVKQSGSVPHRFRPLGRFTHYGRLGPGGGGSERLMIKAFEWVSIPQHCSLGRERGSRSSGEVGI